MADIQGIFDTLSAITFTNFLMFSIIAYFIGFVIDGIGLGIGELFLDKLLYKQKSDKRKFFKDISEHAFEYKNRQWAYYSGYRNLLLLTLPSLYLLSNFVINKYGMGWGLLTLGSILMFQVLIVITMAMLLRLYYSIEESF